MTTELPLNTEVQVVQATERFAEVALVSPGVEPVAASGDVSPATPNAEPVETFFVEARGLQDTRQQGSELMRLAADAASEGKPGEQLELMTRAALLGLLDQIREGVGMARGSISWQHSGQTPMARSSAC